MSTYGEICEKKINYYIELVRFLRMIIFLSTLYGDEDLCHPGSQGSEAQRTGASEPLTLHHLRKQCEE
jgi:hypothetical protein